MFEPRHLLASTLASICVAVLAPQVRAAATPVESKVSSVTLYRGQALVTRDVRIDGEPGGVEVVVTDLPENIVPGSMFAEGDQQIEVRAVQYRNRAVGEEPREEVRQLDRSIEQIKQRTELNKKQQQLMLKRTEYLDKLEGFTAATAKSDTSHGVLDAESLERITAFSFEQRARTAEEEVELTKQARELQDELTLLERRRAKLTNGSSRTVREAVLFLQKHAADQSVVRLNYLVNQCGWSPTYTIRAESEQKHVQVEYNALIHQVSGEDWDSVRLTLSTASPALSAAGPGLAPFRVALATSANGPAQLQQNADDLLAEVQSIKGRQYDAIIQNRESLDFAQNTATAWNINDIANEWQTLEIFCEQDLVTTLKSKSNENGEGPSLSYQLAGGVTLPSRNDQQMVRILQTDLPTHFYHVATPVLTSYVYREASLDNVSREDLLAGPIAVYLDGRFVGRGEIPTVARGQSFVVGFGADPQLRTRRELADKTDHVQGGNRELRFTYHIFVENYKRSAATVRVLDRLPLADRAADVRVTMGELEDPLSQNRLYQRRERPTGILRWEVEVPAGATGEDARLIQYSYTIEYDRNMQLTSARGTQQMQLEFEQLQRARSKQ